MGRRTGGSGGVGGSIRRTCGPYSCQADGSIADSRWKPFQCRFSRRGRAMSNLEFVDTHVHFWDLREPTLRYTWLQPEAVHPELGEYGAIKSLCYRAADLVAETRFQNVSAVIHVQAALGIEDPVEETRWLQASADRLGAPQGIVAYVDLASPDAAATITRHREYSNVRGVRDLRYDNYLTEPGWERGLSALEGTGLVLCDDPLVEVMGDAAELAKRHPGVTFCVDHAGFPRRRDREYFEAWRAGMRKLAAVDSTVIKISDLAMCDHGWTVESIRRWVEECINAWGTKRAFFGTNWPVDRLFSSYGDVIDAYREIIRDLPHDKQVALFSGNATRTFQLQSVATSR